MANQEKTLEKVVLTRLLRLNAAVQGLVTGIILGLGIFVATIWLLIKAEEGDVIGPHLALLGQFFIGYRVTFVGSLVGFAYGFVIGGIAGYGMARLYNWVVDLKKTRDENLA